MKRLTLSTFMALLCAPLWFAVGDDAAGDQLSPDTVKLPEMTPSLNLGKLSYDAKCAQCHGVNTVGTDKGPTFLHRVYHPNHHADGAFYLAPKRGVRAHHWRFGNMPPVKDISDNQIKSITAYVRAVQQANGIF